MSKKEILIKANDYTYPSLDERKEAVKNYPKLTSIGFKYKSGLESLINDELSFGDALKKENLYWWDNCLLNRLGILKETYIFMLTNYMRGFDNDYSNCSQKEIVNRLQFDYFAEIFYYFFFSSRDLIAQIIRLYYKIDIKENKLHFNEEFIQKISELKVKTSMIAFFKATKDASDFRNGFAHRFTPTISDYRLILTEENGNECLNLGSGDFAKSVKIVENINDSLASLKILIDDLKQELIIE